MISNNISKENLQDSLLKYKVSVIVPTVRLEEGIKLIFNRLNKKLIYEFIIIIDGPPQEDVQEYSEFIQSDSRIKVFFTGRQGGPAWARNCGIDKSSGDILLFIDSDCIPMPELIEHHLKHYGNDKIVGVAGVTNLIPGEDIVSAAILHSGALRSFRLGELMDFVPWCTTSNLSVRREMAEKVKFDVSLLTAEDILFGYQIRKNGKLIKGEKDAVVEHAVWKGLYNTCKRSLRYGRGMGFLIYKNSREKLIEIATKKPDWEIFFLFNIIICTILGIIFKKYIFFLLPLIYLLTFFIIFVFCNLPKKKFAFRNLIEVSIVGVFFISYGMGKILEAMKRQRYKDLFIKLNYIPVMKMIVWFKVNLFLTLFYLAILISILIWGHS